MSRNRSVPRSFEGPDACSKGLFTLVLDAFGNRPRLFVFTNLRMSLEKPTT
jgi:hypothetical protein